MLCPSWVRHREPVVVSIELFNFRLLSYGEESIVNAFANHLYSVSCCSISSPIDYAPTRKGV